MKRLRVAGVGAGYFSQFHLQGWRALSEVELVGWTDRDLSKVKGVPAYASVEELLDKARPDLVDIVTPPETHLELVRAVAERNLPMICQKPLAPTFEEAVAVVEAGGKLVVHENFRWQPWYREARRQIERGLLGELHSIAFRLRPGDGQGPRAYLDRQPYFQKMPRLLVHETAIHWIDTFRFLMGEMWLEGSAGVLRLDGDARLWWKPHHQPEAEHRYDRGPDDVFGGGCCRALQAHVVKALAGEAPLENAGKDYLINLRVVEAVYRSSVEGRRIALP